MIPSIRSQMAQSVAPVIGVRHGSFSPQALFAKGQKGAWYDPSDLSTLFQDAAGTIPVTGTGQPVGLMRDKSGRGNHATQATAASRPIFRDVGGLRYLECDGVDDGMVTGNIDFTGTDKMLVCAGVRKLSDALTYKTVISLGAGSANAGCFELDAPGPVNTFRCSAKGSTGSEAASTSTATFISPASAVLSAITDISGAAEVVLRVNAVPCTPSAGYAMSGTFSSNPIGVGCRAGGTSNFNGIFYGAVIAGAAYSASQIASAERYLAGKSGVTL